MNHNYVVASTPRYRALAEEVIARLEYGDLYIGKPVSVAAVKEKNPDILAQLIKDNYAEYEHEVFLDGENYERYTDFDAMYGKHVLLIGGMIDAQETLDLFYMASTIAEIARAVTIVVPYFGYSTMERRTKPGEIVKAAKNAHLLKSIPNGIEKNTFLFFDLHTEGLPYYLGEDVRKFHIYTKALVFEACDKISNGEEFVLGSVDTGRSKWIESLAKELTLRRNDGKTIRPAIISKERMSGSKTEVTGYSGASPDGKIVIIYDDMVRSGGSVTDAARVYRELGAKAVYMITTHAVFTDEPLQNGQSVAQKLLDSGVIDGLWVTDTHVNAFKYPHEKMVVQSIAGLITKAVRRNTEFI